MKKKLTFMQPITRVHNIFRIRTVVNHVTKFNQEKRFPGDKEIGMVLAQTGLSKYRRQKMKDRIMRRARDHLLTAAYMGLLTRIGRPFRYSSTPSGAILSKYGLGEECPKDSLEEAVFIDKIMRMKLTNVYDMQSGGRYEALRSRPCLYILYILSLKKWMHQHQIAVASGGKRCDPKIIDKTTKSLFSEVSDYDELSSDSLNKFYSDFGIGDEDMKNMTRNIRPLLDWCEAVGLVESKALPDTPGRWYSITDRGAKILTFYSNLTPVWFNDLGATPIPKAALLLLYQHLFWTNGSVEHGLLNLKVQAGLTTISVSDLLNELREKLHLKFNDSMTRIETPIDFTLEYDVPPENRDEVRSYLKIFCERVNIKVSDVISFPERGIIESLARSLEQEHQAVKVAVTGKFSTSTALVSDPILTRVSEIIPSVGVLSQYRSDFEKEVALLLRLLNLNAIKYQGQLADRCTKRHIMKFFENNPDILIINHIESLVECKSVSEWRSPLSGEKSVSKEIVTYQQFMPQVRLDSKPNSTVIIYEGLLDTDSYEYVAGLLEDAKEVVFVTKNYLINCVHQPSLREKLLKVIKNPRNYDARSRILSR